MQHRSPDVSVLMPFRDDEDIVGSACTRLAEHLGGLGLSFELLAIEEDSGDNSHAVLGLLRGEIAELEVLYADNRERGFATAAQKARGRVVLMIDAEGALKPLAPLARAIRRTLDGDVDGVFAPDRFAVCHRMRTLDSLAAVRGRKLTTLRRKISAARGRVEVLGSQKRRWLAPKGRPNRGLGRLITALLLPRI